MTRDEAEETVMAVEVGFDNRYGITKAQYAEALLLICSEESVLDNREPRFLCLGCSAGFVTPIKKGNKPFLFPTCPACGSSAISSARILTEEEEA